MLRLIGDHSETHYCNNNLRIAYQDSIRRMDLLSGLSFPLDTSIKFSFIHFRNSASEKDRYLFSTFITPKFAISQSEAVSTPDTLQYQVRTDLIRLRYHVQLTEFVYGK